MCVVRGGVCAVRGGVCAVRGGVCAVRSRVLNDSCDLLQYLPAHPPELTLL